MWHPDIIHGVEEEDSAQQHPSNVVYTAALPMCPLNARYISHFPSQFTRNFNRRSLRLLSDSSSNFHAPPPPLHLISSSLPSPPLPSPPLPSLQLHIPPTSRFPRRCQTPRLLRGRHRKNVRRPPPPHTVAALHRANARVSNASQMRACQMPRKCARVKCLANVRVVNASAGTPRRRTRSAEPLARNCFLLAGA